MKNWLVVFFSVVVFGHSQLLAENAHFVSVWQVDEVDKSVVLPIPRGFSYDFSVDWGDGSQAQVTAYDDSDAAHVYERPGTYTVTISGVVEAWSFWKIPDSKDKIISVTDLGNVGWQSFFGAFLACKNLTTFAGGDTSQVTDMRYMFHLAPAVTPDVSGWDTSNVTRMDGLFWQATAATPDVSSWNTAKVIDMSYMFADATAANPDVSNWDISQVVRMRNMFYRATTATPNMSKWNFMQVEDMLRMFWGVTLPTETYSNMLARIAETSDIEGVVLHAGYSKYNASGAEARKLLVSRGWFLIDGGQENESS